MVVGTAAACDHCSHDSGLDEIHRRATDDVWRAIGIRLQAQGAQAVDFEFERLIVGRAEEIRGRSCARIAGGPPEVVSVLMPLALVVSARMVIVWWRVVRNDRDLGDEG